MPRELLWSPASVEDLQSISDYIRRDSPRHATQVIEAIILAAESLLQFPHMGWTVPETNDPAIRERILYTYRLIYRVSPTRIEIIAIIHGARDVTTALAPHLP